MIMKTEYIKPEARYVDIDMEAIMEEMPASEGEGYGDPMTNEASFEEEATLPDSKSVWD